ncbi:MAG: hypothetical protein QMB08_05625 [Acidimicrobiales bacterium]|jgi:hypothetical protein
MIFGENLLALLVLAIGAALAFGNFMALLRPRDQEQLAEGELERPPLARSIAMIALGLLAAVWALGSLITADDADQTPTAAAVASSDAATER